ncbi:MAG: 5'-methylthioadenosine/S-adenosylhomocysteine nucleosidase [Bacilli bacterium]|nr:5'-methylthioadenosine/S-adenosylhomocysteine nucleosidase [Bacilli bacterium]
MNESVIRSSRDYGYGTIYEAEKDGIPFLAGVSGIGKAFAASLITAICLTHPEVEEIVNIGAGGSLSGEKAPLLSAVIASSFSNHDIDTTSFGDPIGLVSGLNIVDFPASKRINGSLESVCKRLEIPYTYGVISTGDQFIVDEDKKEKIAKVFGAISVDMESAAMAQIAYTYKKEFSALRIVSDTGNQGEYEAYVGRASELAKDVAIALLKA